MLKSVHQFPQRVKRRHYLVFPLIPDLRSRLSCRRVPLGLNTVLFVSIYYPCQSCQILVSIAERSSGDDGLPWKYMGLEERMAYADIVLDLSRFSYFPVRESPFAITRVYEWQVFHEMIATL